LDHYYLGIKIDERKKWKNIGKFVIVAALILLVISSLTAVVVNVFDIQVPVFNPAPSVVWRYFELDYTQNTFDPSLRVYVNLTTSGNFVQGQAITMYVSGSIKNELLQNLTSVYPYGYGFRLNSTSPPYPAISNDSGITVGFAGAPLSVSAVPLFPFLADVYPNSELNPSQYSPTGTAVELIVNATNPNVPILSNIGTNISALTQTVVWTAQGDYHPEVSFFTGNIIVKNTKNNDQIYENIVIHIDSSETLQAARYNRIDEVVSIVLVIFVLIEASKLIWENLKKD
jgi:hypothetical protein